MRYDIASYHSKLNALQLTDANMTTSHESHEKTKSLNYSESFQECE